MYRLIWRHSRKRKLKCPYKGGSDTYSHTVRNFAGICFGADSNRFPELNDLKRSEFFSVFTMRDVLCVSESVLLMM